jgi:co-chaperonin GroES (HSP10)
MLSDEETTSSGIIVAPKNSACVRYKVCYTNELTKDLQDKEIYAEARYKNHQLPNAGDNGETYVVIPVEEVLAVKA